MCNLINSRPDKFPALKSLSYHSFEYSIVSAYVYNKKKLPLKYKSIVTGTYSFNFKTPIFR